MLAGQRHHTRARRGIVLVLVLAMLGLLALIGVTFATFSGQARINARLFAQSVIRPQDDELMDFALQQLITDTTDVRSVLHGHSLARDMFGNDAFNNGFLAFNPAGGPMQITLIKQVPNTPPGITLYDVQTNIPTPAISPLMYGYNFTRWIMRVSWIGSVTSGSPQPVSQTCEILIDDYLPGQSNTQFSGNAAGTHAFRISPIDTPQAPNTQTILNNPTLGYISYNANNPFPGWPTTAANGTPLALTGAFNAYFAGNTAAINNVAFTLDGRWLYAFNGPGLGTQTRPVTIGNLTLNVPLSTYANFRYNGLHANAVGMDEDYDACDLENWFLAIQSADGQVMIPSFHRPGVVRHDPTNPTLSSDWNAAFRTAYWYDSAPRMLRPVAADGHDPATFPDLTPDPVTGKINYDVDNDGDGVTDSVWLDLGYPTRRDANGVLYKPLFAFMVIGLNGRIPLNTAGNLAGGSASHANHLGNSASEIDPTYALQNAFIPPLPPFPAKGSAGDYDPFNAFGVGAWPPNGQLDFHGTKYGFTTNNMQVDNTLDNANNGFAGLGGTDVRLTQLRNLLAGTRPQTNPLVLNATANGDANAVLGSWPGTGAGANYFLPNSVVDSADNIYYTDPSTNTALVARTTPTVPGRWGEASSIPGVPFNNPSGGPPTYLNLVQPNYANPVRAGYSYDVADFLTNAAYNNTPFPRDAADDNYNAFDVYPPQQAALARVGEVYDLDYYDPAGALMLPVERMRRFVTPIDINGTGRVGPWTGGGSGYDNYGRVMFNSYFRPAGVAGPMNISPDANSTYPYGAIAPPAAGGYGTWDQANGTVTPWTTANPTTYQPDWTNNPFHGYESFKLPNQVQVAGGTITNPNPPNPTRMGGMPIDKNAQTNFANYPGKFPTYDSKVNSSGRLDGVNEADEMNLYTQNPLLDSPYGPADLEWLYRQQDVDGVSLTSRLAQLAPISFTNTIDGMRRRRLVALDTWESNSFVWANDNPGGAFANNAWFTAAQSPTMPLFSAKFAGQLPPVGTYANNPNVISTPSLAHRNRKINLNYPLPVSNDPNEPVRQKWISDTYQLLKAVLPPDSVDTAEELAQLSQFVINIIDFRDPDATMTHWTNPDVVLTPATVATAYPTLTKSYGGGNLDQYGMEYNPVAINEVLAYGFQSRSDTTTGSATYTNRFFIELVNTLTAAYNPTFDTTNNDATLATMSLNNYYGYGPTPGQQTNPTSPNDPSGGNITGNPQFPNPGPPYQASTLDLGGFTWINPVNNSGKVDPYGAGCWDIVFTADNTMSRPDPYRGELVNSTLASYYSVVPLNRDAVSSTSGGAGGNNIHAQNGGDVTLMPLATNANAPATSSPVTTPTTANPPLPATNPPTPPITYFYVVGSPTSGNEVNSISATTGAPLAPCVTQYFASTFDPMSGSGIPPTLQWRQGVLPGVQLNQATGVATPPANYQGKLPYYTTPPASGASGAAQNLWVCLRRPANPFAPVSLTNPMCVVDCMRFPYIDGTANPGGTWSQSGSTVYPSGTANTIFSAQRLQPYRGGHAVPMPNATSTTNPQGMSVSLQPPDPRYGYSEQICVPATYARSSTYGAANKGTGAAPASTNMIYHSLGYYNDGAENWDYFPFNDRDFSSVAELLLVPGCPPGLFTKQFVEFAPSQMNAADIFAQVQPIMSATSTIGSLPGNNTQQGQPLPASTYPIVPFATATVPFLSVSQATVGTAIGSNPTPQGSLPTTVPAFPAVGPTGLNPAQPTGTLTSPVQPHTFPYLVDKFFYTGAASFLYPPQVGPNGQTQQYTLTLGGPGTTDPSATNNPVVGGPASDGWFKMFEFFEVPSQMTGAVGPVALGTNFDWARQDTRAGLMNLNLIVDEEAFYAVFGDQGSNYGESVLNSIELPLLATYNSNNGQFSLPYNMPLSQNNYHNAVNTVGNPPIPHGGPPVPLVVSAIQVTGAPNYAYPVTDQTQQIQHGYLAGTDPIQQAINTLNGVGNYPAPGNRIKAAFAQFLWIRHGGSGFMFGYGNGGTGQNSAVATPSLSLPYMGATPAERPFRALSFPDIDFTIMRPAALPPSAPINNGPASNPAMVANNNIPLLTPVTNAQALIYTPAAGTTLPPWYWVNSTLGVGTVEPNYYAPFVATTPFPANHFGTGVPIVYTGDPGVRNPFLAQGYAASDTTNITPPYPVYPGQAANSVPAGVPLPVNVAFPNGGTPPTMDSVAMPPPIPPARLFQPPDAYGAGQMQSKSYTGIYNNGTGNISPAVSNASDSGDPWINNLVAFQALNPGVVAPSYTLSNGFASLAWSGGTYYPTGGNNPYLTPTGALPTISLAYPPYLISANPGTPPNNLTLDNSIVQNNGNPGPNSETPYLGSGGSDDRQHPYWRTELLQRAMNLTTVRTHQYAVWITIGFFEVKRQGDIDMIAQSLQALSAGNPGVAASLIRDAYDIMGPEVGALNGQNVRYRGFFLVDRLKLTGFNPNDVGAFHNAVVYRKVIQ